MHVHLSGATDCDGCAAAVHCAYMVIGRCLRATASFRMRQHVYIRTSGCTTYPHTSLPITLVLKDRTSTPYQVSPRTKLLTALSLPRRHTSLLQTACATRVPLPRLSRRCLSPVRRACRTSSPLLLLGYEAAIKCASVRHACASKDLNQSHVHLGRRSRKRNETGVAERNCGLLAMSVGDSGT